MIEILAALAALIASVWILVYLVNKDMYDKLRDLPGPKGLPLVGNALGIGSNPVDILKSLTQCCKDFPSIFRLWIGPLKPLVVITNAEYLEILLTSQKHITKGSDYDYLRPWIGDGLLTSTGDKWKKQRKLLTPAFHFKILEEFIERFDSNGDILLHKLEKEVGKQYVDIYPYITMAALDIISETAMGLSLNAQNNPETEYVKAVKDMCNIVIFRMFTLLSKYDLTFQFCHQSDIQRRSLKVLHDMTDSVIKKKRRELESRKEHKGQVDEVGRKKKAAFLDLLLESTMDGEPLSDHYIREEADTFMFEGHDTVSSGISFALYELSRHPEIQEKVVDELRDILGDDPNKHPTYTELQEMKYLEMVIKESLRINPSVPGILRHLEEDLDLGDRVLPKGCTISIFTYGLHRVPEYFPDPEKFDPERFNLENSAKRSPYAYLPFSAGPRNCIGQKFAMLEMKSVISKILRRFKLLPAGPDLVLSFEVVLKSLSAVPMKLEKRTNF